MYIINANVRNNVYHLARKLDGSKAYTAACGYYNYVLPGGSHIMVVDKVSGDRRRCKRCDALVIKVQS